MSSGDLSVLCWNVRGLNDGAHRELVRQTAASARPSVLCLQETKIGSMSQTIALDTLGQSLSKFVTLDAQGTRGGILLAWDEDLVSVLDVQCKVFMILAVVTMLLSNVTFLLTTCYGPADDRRKEEFLRR